MSKLQTTLIVIGISMIVGGILLLLFPQIMKYVFGILGILVGVGLIGMVARSNFKSTK